MRTEIRSRTAEVGMFVLLLSLWAWGAHAQTNYAVNWFTIDGGGGTGAGGVFTVSGTIGQPDAGPKMSGGNYAVQGGFWSLAVGAVQTPGAPLLNVRLTATNSVVVSWPSPSPGFVLQENASVGSTNWTTVSQAPIDDGTTRTLTVPSPSGNRYYRLHKP